MKSFQTTSNSFLLHPVLNPGLWNSLYLCLGQSVNVSTFWKYAIMSCCVIVVAGGLIYVLYCSF